MSDSVLKQVADLKNLTHEELKNLWRTLNGDKPPAYNRMFIINRLAYRIQEIAYGGLSNASREQMQRILKDGGFDANGCDSSRRRKHRETRQKRDSPVVDFKSQFVLKMLSRICSCRQFHDSMRIC